MTLFTSRQLLCVFAFLFPITVAASAQDRLDFSCGGHLVHGQRLSASTRLPTAMQPATDPALPPFGFDLTATPSTFAQGACASDKRFFFSVVLPEGNYQVSLNLGAPEASTTTVRAESRRLMIDRRSIPAGGSSRVVFNVNVRSPIIVEANTAPNSAPAQVKLKPRELASLDWDRKLTLEFNGNHPALRSLSIRRVDRVPTIYLVGDSTVVDQDKEPWAAWGQILPLFFGPRIAISNHAESGESLRSFTAEGRFRKILSTLRAADFVLIQFAHNDQKLGTPEQTHFKAELQSYCDAIRSKGATPILVTSMNRRTFDAAGHITDSLGGYPQAMRQLAAEQNITLIDLNEISRIIYEAMGPERSLKAFVHYPANTFPNQPEELEDDTHFNSYGAYELARAIVAEMQAQKLPLAAFLQPGIPPFNPAHPDDPSTLSFPPSPLFTAQAPDGH